MNRLTPVKIKQLKPRPYRYEVSDAGKPGLRLVVHPSGKMSWIVRYRRHGDKKPRKLTLDGFTSLKTAHRLAQQALDVVEDGGDPAGSKQAEAQRRRAQEMTGDNSFGDVARQFITKYARGKKKDKEGNEFIRLRSWREVARLIGLRPDPENDNELMAVDGGLVARWGKRPLVEIRRREIAAELDRIVEAGGGVSANRTLAALRKLWNWAMSRDDEIVANPCKGVTLPVEEVERDRYLGDDSSAGKESEIAWFWRACDSIAESNPVDARKGNSPFGPVFKLLLLTGARRSEVAGMKESEINRAARTWTIPRERAKNNQEHVVPLSDLAMQTIDGIKRVRGKAKLLFTTDGEHPLSGWSNAKEVLDEALTKLAAGVEIRPWRLHDLRRTTASRMAKLGAAPHIVEAVLNHRTGVIKGVAKVYNRNNYETEKRDAVDRLARDIDGIVSGRIADVNTYHAGR